MHKVRLAAWNLNNRVGMTRFRPDAADAAAALDADLLVLTEYYPQRHHEQFIADLAAHGYRDFLRSATPLGVRANQQPKQVLFASRLPLKRLDLREPRFDDTFAGNVLGAKLPMAGLSVLGLRVLYDRAENLSYANKAWAWIESAAEAMQRGPGLIIGDPNVRVGSSKRGGDVFSRLSSGRWPRVHPRGEGSYFSSKGGWKEIDHALCTPNCAVSAAHYVSRVDGYVLAGHRNALSDHAALVLQCQVQRQDRRRTAT